MRTKLSRALTRKKEPKPEPKELELCKRHGIALDNCEACSKFRCSICRKLVPWDRGAADNMPSACDDCWFARYEKRAS